MKHKKYFFLLLLFCGINFPGVNAQTLSQIIASHIKAIGGKEKIKQIKTVVIKSTIVVASAAAESDAGKLSVNSLERITNGKGYRKDVTSEAGELKLSQTECYTDNTGQISGWTTAPQMPESINETKPRAMSEQEYNTGKDLIYIGNPFINYPSQEMKVKLIKKFNGQYCIGVKTNYWTRLYYLDINTFYITRIEELMARGLKSVTIFKDYNNVSGVVIPYSITTKLYGRMGLAIAEIFEGENIDLFDEALIGQDPNEKPLTTTTRKVTNITVTVNEPIDSSIYNFPED